MFNERPFKRSDRVSDKVKLIISEILLKNISISNNGLITITKVDMSKDLRYAKIFFSHIYTGFTSEDLEKKLNLNKSKIRYYMGNNLDSQYVPKIIFKLDKRYAKSNRIENLLNKVNKSNKWMPHILYGNP